MTFIEEVVSWDDINEWFWLLYEAYGSDNIEYKNAEISKVIDKLERIGAVRIYPYKKEGEKMTDSGEIIIEDYTDKTKPMPKHWWRFKEEGD